MMVKRFHPSTVGPHLGAASAPTKVGPYETKVTCRAGSPDPANDDVAFKGEVR